MSRKPKYLTDIKTFNEEFGRLVKLRQELKSAKDQTDELIRSLNENSELPDEVRTHIDGLKTELATMQAAYTTASTYIKEIKDYKESFDTVKGSIDEELELASKQNETLSQYITETQNLKATITDETKRAKTLLDDARNTLQIVTNSSLSSVFVERSREREKSRKRWLWGVLAYFTIFVGALYFIITEVAKDNAIKGEIGAWVLKVAITAPFIYLLYFLTKQYTQERDLEEKYAFKALISQTISNNTKLLKDEYSTHANNNPEVYDKMLNFTVESMKQIYNEPFKQTSFASKLKFSPKNTDVSAEVTQKER